jgi:hypothetical protein
MKKPVSFLEIFLPVTLVVAGCKNPVDLGSLGDLNFNERVTVGATFENGDGVPTIASLSVTWDGQFFQETSPSSAVAQVAVSGVRLGREKGSHRLSFRIVGQTSSPSNYRVTGLEIRSYDGAGRLT